MKEKIKYQNLKEEFFTAENCFITEISNSPDDPELSIARARVAAGATTKWHLLKGTTERYYILQGKGLVEIGNHPAQEVNSGDVVIIPSMCRQRITNIGQEDLIFLAICTPRFRNEVYEEIGSIHIQSEKPME